MNDRTMVKVTASGDYICFRTISRNRKSPQAFYVLRGKLDGLETGHTVWARDIYSLAEMWRDELGRLVIHFVWLSGIDNCGSVKGYEETVMLNYNAFIGFVQNSIHDGAPKEWTALAENDTGRLPVLDFSNPGAQKILRDIARVPGLRRKLSRALRDNFHWTGSARIYFYKDYGALDFFFREEQFNGECGICGGLILHGRENMSTARYEIHT